ncbi:MAG: hypothetical protein M3082_18960 [Candidatus Dormibacteraeota bacterium]|nr:hypothetical protein [Candidatus Dormibacteraeota bacterium]
MFRGLLGLVVFAAFAPSSALAATPGTWVPAGHLLSPPKEAYVVNVTTGKDGLIYAVGSTQYTGKLAAQTYNPATRKSTYIATPPGGGCVVTGAAGKIWVINTAMTSAYSPTKSAWSSYAVMPSSIIGGGGPCVTGADGMIYVIDTWRGTTVYRYDPNANSWTALSATAPANGYEGVAVLGPDQNLYVIGNNGPYACTIRMDLYHPTTNSWTTGATPSVCAASTATIGPDGRLYAGWAGTNTGVFMGAYSFVTSSWSTLPASPNAGSLATAAGALYSIGGHNLKYSGAGTSVFKFVP